MPARETAWCAHGRDPESCCLADIAGALPKGIGGDGRNRLCPVHDDRHASLSINPGTRGMRIVWNCNAGCDAGDVRAAMLGLGIDESCLGRYGLPKRIVQPGMRISGHDPALVADAKRWHAVRKMPPDLNGSLLRMCIQAIGEGDGDVAGNPAALLPADRAEFLALAARTGIERGFRYRVWDQWVRYQAA